jgi:hypothetical protein
MTGLSEEFNSGRKAFAVDTATKAGGKFLPSFQQMQQATISARDSTESFEENRYVGTSFFQQLEKQKGTEETSFFSNLPKGSEKSTSFFGALGKTESETRSISKGTEQFNSLTKDQQSELVRLSNKGEEINSPQSDGSNIPVTEKKRGTRKQTPNVLSSRTTKQGGSPFSLLSGRSGGLLGN